MFGVTGLHFAQLASNRQNTVKRWAYRFHYILWIVSWLAGHLLGGIALFGLLAWLGAFLIPFAGSIYLAGLALLCFLTALHHFNVIRLPLPQLRRQVSRLWLPHFHKNLVAFGYGFQLGSGVATRIKTATTYIVIGCAFCSGSWLAGASIGAVFGLSRAVLPVVLAGQNKEPGKSLNFAMKFNSYDGKVQRLNAAALFIAGVTITFSTFIPQFE